MAYEMACVKERKVIRTFADRANDGRWIQVTIGQVYCSKQIDLFTGSVKRELFSLISFNFTIFA